MLQAPPHRRGHAHKRSAAISGDFDLEFFKQTPSSAQQVSTSAPAHSPNPYLTPKTPSNKSTTTTTFDEFPTPTLPSLVVTEADARLSTSTPSPKKHTRINSWAHSMIKSKQKESDIDYSSSSSNENTPELKRQAVNYSYTTFEKVPLSPPSLSSYKIPEAVIDLDLASGVYHDPAAPSSSTVPTSFKSRHRRTESAPELEDFLKYKVFSSTPSNKNSRRNSAIFEEEDEDEEQDILSSTSSNNNLTLVQNPSFNSLNSASSSNQRGASYPQQQQQQQLIPASTASTPTSTKTSATTATRRGASAKRYQNYYNNNLLISNALKSSESLSNVINKPSIPSLSKSLRPNISSSSSSSSVNSSIANSPSRFGFESQVYDIPKSPANFNTPVKSKQPSPSKTITVTPKKTIAKQHKKSNSLFSTISMKIRRNSISSTPKQSSSKRSVSDGKPEPPQQTQQDDEYCEGDSTITPFNFGEPGPELDLTTMTQRYPASNDNDDFNLNNTTNELNEPRSTSKSPDKKSAETPKKHKKTFFHWRKK